MTGDTVTRAEPDRVLSSDPADGDWLRDPNAFDGNLVIGNNANFTCDGCHQVHDANSNSASFILDVANANDVVSTSVDVGYRTVGPYTSSYSTRYQLTPGSDHSGFCDMCHPYK
jgi:hypothetical protein